MMAEATGWNSTALEDRSKGEDMWHVVVTPDDVKVVSLEQLDDLFRLSLVDSETKVWQVGMSEWLPLGVVAGLDEKPAPIKRPEPPAQRSAPPPRHNPDAMASFVPEPLALGPAPVLYTAPVVPMPSLAPIASVRPLVVSHTPHAAQPRAGGFGRLIVGLTLAAGIGITLYRNDVLRDAAHALRQETLYRRFEQALGGPSFGTLREVEQSAPRAASAAPLLTDDAVGRTPQRAVAPTIIAAPVADPISTAQTPNAGTQPPVVTLESLGTVEAKPVPPAQKPASRATGRARLDAGSARAAHSNPPSSKKTGKLSTGLKGSSEYDPLNPKL